jgi:3-isopropylmalate dehydrogenase
LSQEHNIALIPGDGTGPEVTAEGRKVLEAISDRYDIRFKFFSYPLGGDHYLTTGELLPESVINELKEMSAVYLGAIGHPGVRPGILEREILLRLRFELDLYINLRPVILFPGVFTPLKGKGPEDIDFVVIRENTEGLYTGMGGVMKKGTPDEVAIQESISTRKGVERCIQYSFDYCRKRDKDKHLTLCGKSNVLTYEFDLWERVFQEVHREYDDISTDYYHVDAICMWMVKNPEQFDVIVTNNIFGDIITDLGAIIQGGLGIAAGGNINPEGTAMFEPIGGSAPKYAGSHTINPLAALSAAQMMLEYLREQEAADALQKAIKTVVRDKLKNLEAGKMGYSTEEVGDLVAGSVRGSRHRIKR